MQWYSWLSLLVLPALILAEEPPEGIEIKTTFSPETCTLKAEKGDTVTTHYTGTLFSSGEKFDSSLDRGEPIKFKLGAGQVIKGWDESLEGMCLNEKRIIIIPPEKAYGKGGVGEIIPPNSHIVFDVELLAIQKPKTDL